MLGDGDCEWARGLLDKLVVSYIIFISLVSVGKGHRQADDESMMYCYIKAGRTKAVLPVGLQARLLPGRPWKRSWKSLRISRSDVGTIDKYFIP